MVTVCLRSELLQRFEPWEHLVLSRRIDDPKGEWVEIVRELAPHADEFYTDEGKPLSVRIPNEAGELEEKMPKVVNWMTQHMGRRLVTLRVYLLDRFAKTFDTDGFLERAVNEAQRADKITQEQAEVLRVRWLKLSPSIDGLFEQHKSTLKELYWEALESTAPFVQWEFYRVMFGLRKG